MYNRQRNQNQPTGTARAGFDPPGIDMRRLRFLTIDYHYIYGYAKTARPPSPIENVGTWYTTDTCNLAHTRTDAMLPCPGEPPMKKQLVPKKAQKSLSA